MFRYRLHSSSSSLGSENERERKREAALYLALEGNTKINLLQSVKQGKGQGKDRKNWTSSDVSCEFPSSYRGETEDSLRYGRALSVERHVMLTIQRTYTHTDRHLCFFSIRAIFRIGPSVKPPRIDATSCRAYHHAVAMVLTRASHNFSHRYRPTVKTENTSIHTHGCPSLVLSDITLDSPTESPVLLCLGPTMRTDHCALWRPNPGPCKRTNIWTQVYPNDDRTNERVSELNDLVVSRSSRDSVCHRKTYARFSGTSWPAYYFPVAQARACAPPRCCVDCSAAILRFYECTYSGARTRVPTPREFAKVFAFYASFSILFSNPPMIVFFSFHLLGPRWKLC